MYKLYIERDLKGKYKRKKKAIKAALEDFKDFYGTDLYNIERYNIEHYLKKFNWCNNYCEYEIIKEKKEKALKF